MKRVIMRRPDGCVSILILSPEQETDIKVLSERALLNQPSGSVIIGECDHTDLPQSRYFRNQWRMNGSKVVVDMGLARERKMELIREERNKRLNETDGPYMRDLERGEDVVKLKQKRQALRDLPQTLNLDEIKTPEELEEFKPSWPE